MRFLVAVALVLGVSGSASAHPHDVGYLRLEPKGDAIVIQLDIELAAAAAALKVDEKLLDPAGLASRAIALADVTYRRAAIKAGGAPCTWGTPATELIVRTVRITDTATCAGGSERTWEFPMIREARISPTFELLVKQVHGDTEDASIIDRYAPQIVLGEAGMGSFGFGEFLWSGVEHIGAAPSEWHDEDGWKLPDGIDHILFLLALILGGGTLLQLIGIASGFTVGHSITLALSALNVVRPPPSVIEPLIALSIAFVAVEAMTGLWKKHRWKIATFFGLVHGFGFANALSGLELSTGQFVKALFGFNLGVEVGQLMLMLVLVPLVFLAHKNKPVEKYMIKGLAALICVAGIYWFFQRIVG